MKTPESWISPITPALFLINELEIPKKAYSETESFVVQIEMSPVPLPFGTVLTKWEIQELNENQYEICTHISAPKEHHKRNLNIKTCISTNTISIYSPYFDYILLANDLAFFALYKDNTLTIRCSSFKLGDVLYMFCGQSNSGKSTIVKNAKDYFDNIHITSDDHLSLKPDVSPVMINTPIWDEINTKLNTQAEHLVIYFLNDTINAIYPITNNRHKFNQLTSNCVLFTFSEITTNKISELSEQIIKKAQFVISPSRDAHNVLEHIRKHHENNCGL